MKKISIKSIKTLFTAGIALIVLFAATQVMAAPLDPSKTVKLSASRTCDLFGKGGAKVAGVEAGYAGTFLNPLDPSDGALPGLNPTFPRIIACPVSSGTCAAWDFRWNQEPGVNFAHTFVTASSDQAIEQVIPNSADVENTAGDGINGLGEFVLEKREVRFNADQDTTFATIITSMSFPRIATAGAEFGRLDDFCLILGPGVDAPSGPSASSECITLGPEGVITMKVDRSGPSGCDVDLETDVTVFLDNPMCLDGVGTVVDPIFTDPDLGTSTCSGLDGDQCSECLRRTLESPLVYEIEVNKKLQLYCYDENTFEQLTCQECKDAGGKVTVECP